MPQMQYWISSIRSSVAVERSWICGQWKIWAALYSSGTLELLEHGRYCIKVDVWEVSGRIILDSVNVRWNLHCQAKEGMAVSAAKKS